MLHTVAILFIRILVGTSLAAGLLGDLSPWIKCQEVETVHSPPFSAEVKNDGARLP
jgi:hypothetical protein